MSDYAGEFVSGRDALVAFGHDQIDVEAPQAGNCLGTLAGAQDAVTLAPVPVEDAVMGLDAPVIAVEANRRAGLALSGVWSLTPLTISGAVWPILSGHIARNSPVSWPGSGPGQSVTSIRARRASACGSVSTPRRYG